MIKRKLLYTLKKLTLALFICALPLSASSEVVDRVVAIVNDSIVTMSELNDAVGAALNEMKVKSVDNMDGFKVTILERLIERKLMQIASEKLGIDVSEQEIENAIEDVKKKNGLSQEALIVALAKNGLTFNGYKKELAEQVRQTKFLNRLFRPRIKIEDDEIESYYRQHKGDYLAPPSYNIALILISNRGGKELQSKRVSAALGELAEGESFSNVAATYSDGPAASNGGDMGIVAIGTLDKKIEDRVKALKAGEVSGSFAIASGVAIIKLIERFAAGPKPITDKKVIDNIQNIIFQRSMEEEYSIWLKEMKLRAHIEIKLEGDTLE